jgi:hypothetical protein
MVDITENRYSKYGTAHQPCAAPNPGIGQSILTVVPIVARRPI